MTNYTGPTVPNTLNPSALRDGVYEARDFPANLRERSVPDSGYNVLTRLQSLYDPILDYEYLRRGGEKPTWPGGRDFAVCLTHDLDHVSAYSTRQALRQARCRVRAGWRLRAESEPMLYQGGYGAVARTVAKSSANILRSLLHRGPDPYHGLDRWRELERSHDARSTFFVLPPPSGPAHESDPDYRLDDTIVYDGKPQTVSSALRDLHAKGWEIGLHPTWYAFDDPDALAREKCAIEAAIGDSVVSVRQHYLHYDPRQTPRAHEAAGLRYDSTLGFNDNVGFRRGTAYPWQLSDLQEDRPTSVLELPLVVQDTALFRRKGLGVDPETAFDYVDLLAERVHDVGGVLTLLWHPSSIANDDRWSLYKRTLAHLEDRGAWFGTVREIGEYWQERGPERLIE